MNLSQEYEGESLQKRKLSPSGKIGAPHSMAECPTHHVQATFYCQSHKIYFCNSDLEGADSHFLKCKKDLKQLAAATSHGIPTETEDETGVSGQITTKPQDAKANVGDERPHIILFAGARATLTSFNLLNRRPEAIEMSSEDIPTSGFRSIMLGEICIILGGIMKKDEEVKRLWPLQRHVITVNVNKPEPVKKEAIKLLAPRANHAIALVEHGMEKQKRIIIAGSSYSDGMKKVEYYRPGEVQEVKPMPDLNNARYHFTLCNIENQSLYAIGGRKPAEMFENENTIERLNLMDLNSSWEVLVLKTPWEGRAKHCCFSVSKTEILIIGGQNSYDDEIESFNVKDLEVTKKGMVSLKEEQLEVTSPSVFSKGIAYITNNYSQRVVLYYAEKKVWGAMPFDLL